jgi:hypothetical protein
MGRQLSESGKTVSALWANQSLTKKVDFEIKDLGTQSSKTTFDAIAMKAKC